MPPILQDNTLLNKLHRYSENELRGLQVLAVVVVSINLNHFKTVLRKLSWSHDFVTMKWMNHAKNQGIIESKATGYVVSVDLRDLLSQQASLSGNYLKIIEAANTSFSSNWHYRTDYVNREFRTALYGGDSAQVREFLRTSSHPFIPCTSIPDAYELISCRYLDREWLHRLPDDLQFQFIHLIVNDIILGYAESVTLVEAKVMLEAIPNIKEHDAARCLMASISMWLGDFEKAQAWLPAASTSESLAKRGRLAFLRGDDETATDCYAQALKLKRKESRKRSCTLTEEDMFFHLLTLLRSKNSAEFNKVAKNICTQCKKDDGCSNSFYLVATELLIHICDIRYQKKDADPDDIDGLFHRAQPNAFTTIFFGLAFHWIDAKSGDSENLMNMLLLANLYAQQHQMHWVMWELDHVPKSKRLINSASSDVRTVIKQATGYEAELPASIHDSMKRAGIQSCFNILPREEGWERSLDALKRISAISSDSTANKEQRLVWLFHLSQLDDDYLAGVEPRVQLINKSGAWSKGRKVALARLVPSAKRDLDFSFLSELDKKICAQIHEERNYYSYYNNNGHTLEVAEALVRAVGHPLLFLDNLNTPLTLSIGNVTLNATREKDKIRISIIPYPDDDGKDGDTKILLKRESSQKVVCYTFTEQQLQVARILGTQGLLVPESAKEKAIESISAIAPLLNVHSEVGGGQQVATEVESDSRLHMHLQPLSGGLHAACFVRPFGSAPMLLHPGEGGHTIFTEHEGNTLQTRRDLKQENLLAQAMFTKCSYLDADDGWEWRLDEPQQALETLEQLHALEPDVLIEWPEGKKINLANKIEVNQFRVSIHKQQDWFEMEGEIQLADDQVMGLKQLLSLVQQSEGRFVRLGEDQFISLSKALYQRLDSLQSMTEGGRFHALAAAAIEETTDGMKVRKNRHWQEHLQKLSDARDFQPTLPSTLQADLRDYQQEGFEWMARLTHWGAGACLADDMGLGKTVQALALILSNAHEGPTLVIAPTSVCMNWEAEVARFAPTLRLHNFSEVDRKQTVEDVGPFDLVVCSYALLQRNANLLASREWQAVVLDEAQAIKNPTTKRAKAAMNLTSKVRLITTGTPIENHLGELWSLFQFINPGLLGSLESFNRRFANPIQLQHNKDVAKRLKQLIQPFILRRLKSDVLTELPSRTEITLHVELSKDEMALYEAVRQQAMERLQDNSGNHAGEQRIKILAEIMRLRRACCHPSLVMPDTTIPGSKLQAFGECIEELREGKHKALVFSQFVAHLKILKDYLDKQGISYQYLDGSTPAKQRKVRVDAFQAGEGDVFLISLKAGGSGLNLTAADYVLHMDPWWNPAVEDQASDRAHRIGQKRPVTIYRFIAKNTIEEKIVNLHAQKRGLADSLLEGTDMGGKLSLQEIMTLVEQAEHD